METGCAQCGPEPRNFCEMGDRHHRSREEKNVAEREKQKRRDQANCDQNELDERRF